MERRRTDSSKNSILEPYLSTLCTCYSTGYFDPLFPLLADNIVMESQWVLTPLTGKRAVEQYLTAKGAALRQNHSCPECEIVVLVGNTHPVPLDHPAANKPASVSLWYSEGKLCAFMSTSLQDIANGAIVDLTLDEADKIARIDLCMPWLFQFEPYTPQEAESSAESRFEKTVSLLTDMMTSLTPRERRVMTLLLGLEDGHPKTTAEIAEKYNVNPARIRQIRDKAIRKLAHHPDHEKLLTMMNKKS